MAVQQGATAGWGFPANSRSAHFFRESRSLCGRWMFFGALEVSDAPSPDDCKTCRRKRDKEQGR